MMASVSHHAGQCLGSWTRCTLLGSHTKVHVWSENNVWESGGSFHHVGFGLGGNSRGGQISVS